MRRLTIIALAAFATIAMTSAPAGAAVHQSRARTFGSCRAQGDFAICVASGTAHHPVTIRVHVAASPRQRVSVAWDMTCARGLGAGGKSGHFNARTRVNRVLKHPYRRPSMCIVAADAQLSRSGHLRVWLTYTR